MSPNDLIVEVRNRDFVRVARIDPRFLDGAIFAPRVSDVGSWQLVLPETVDGVEYEPCKLLREAGAGITLHILGDSLTFMSGFMTNATRTVNAADRTGTWTISGVTDETILDGTLVYPNGMVLDPTTQPDRSYKVTGVVGTLVRNAVIDQMALGRPRRIGARRFLNFDADRPIGPVKTAEARFENLLGFCKSLVADTNVNFRVVHTGSEAAVLWITEAVDYSDMTVFDIETGKVETQSTSSDAPTASLVIVAGDGEGKAKAMAVAESSAVVDAWAVPREVYIAGSGTVVSELQETAVTTLAEGAARTGFSVTPREDISGLLPNMLGGIVSVAVGGEVRKARLNEITIAVTSEGVSVGATIGDPDGTDWEGMVNAGIASLAERVSAIERNKDTPYSDGYRLGGKIGTVTDCNLASESGWYQVPSNSAVNRPPADGSLELTVVALASGSVFQTARPHGPNGSPYFEEWVRDKRGDTWSAWRPVRLSRRAFTPVALSGIALGNATVIGEYEVSDGVCSGAIRVTLGSTSSVSGDTRFDLPLPAASSLVRHASGGRFGDVSASNVYDAHVLVTTGGIYARALAMTQASSGTGFPRQVALASTTPFGWTTGDYIEISFAYPTV